MGIKDFFELMRNYCPLTLIDKKTQNPHLRDCYNSYMRESPIIIVDLESLIFNFQYTRQDGHFFPIDFITYIINTVFPENSIPTREIFFISDRDQLPFIMKEATRIERRLTNNNASTPLPFEDIQCFVDNGYFSKKEQKKKSLMLSVYDIKASNISVRLKWLEYITENIKSHFKKYEKCKIHIYFESSDTNDEEGKQLDVFNKHPEADTVIVGIVDLLIKRNGPGQLKRIKTTEALDITILTPDSDVCLMLTLLLMNNPRSTESVTISICSSASGIFYPHMLCDFFEKNKLNNPYLIGMFFMLMHNDFLSKEVFTRNISNETIFKSLLKFTKHLQKKITAENSMFKQENKELNIDINLDFILTYIYSNAANSGVYSFHENLKDLVSTHVSITKKKFFRGYNLLEDYYDTEKNALVKHDEMYSYIKKLFNLSDNICKELTRSL